MKVFSRSFFNFFQKAVTFVMVFFMTFAFLFYFTHNSFRQETFAHVLGSLVKNFVHQIQDNSVLRGTLALFDYRVTGKREELTEYKLTILSKSLDQYFVALLHQTEDLVRQKRFSQILLSKGKWGSWNDAQNILANYLKKNVDVLEFGVYSKAGEKVVGVKYQDIPEYELSEAMRENVSSKKNVLIRHKQSKNLILLSSVSVQGKVAFFITQTLHPVFFSRILKHLEINKELFYVKNGDMIMVDNGDVVAWAQKKASREQKERSVFAGFYDVLTKSNETLIQLNTKFVDYRLGTVLERNNVWGNLFVLSLIALFFVVNFYFIIWVIHVFDTENVQFSFNTMGKKFFGRDFDSIFMSKQAHPQIKKSNIPENISIKDMSFWESSFEPSFSLVGDTSILDSGDEDLSKEKKEYKKDSA